MTSERLLVVWTPVSLPELGGSTWVLKGALDNPLVEVLKG